MKLHTIYYQDGGRIIKDDVPMSELFMSLPAGARLVSGDNGKDIKDTDQKSKPRAVYHGAGQKIIVQEK